MTFDKYKEGREKFNDALFPIDGYEYDYVFDKKIGWHYVKGQKISDMKEQKWDIKKPKGKIMKTLKSIKEWSGNKIEDFHIWLVDRFPLHLLALFFICYFILYLGLGIIVLFRCVNGI